MTVDRVFCVRRDSFLFMVTYTTLLVIINAAFYQFLNLPPEIWTFFYIYLLELSSFGLSYEITQLFLSLFFKKISLPFVEILKDYPRVALVCTTCDNVDIKILKSLNQQSYPNLDIFILDDSQDKKSQMEVDSLNFRILRRCNRNGYKAGSLNNWLIQQGQNYPYFIVADADSILPNCFVEQMIAYAEHPDNSDVAIFESLIGAWNHNNKFARLLGTMTPIIHRRKLCLDNRFHSNLSVGHNNLYRTSIIKFIGGFKEEYLAEDYATSIEVLRKKYLCMTVPVLSLERLPENFHEFVGRQSRWTIQAFQLMNLKVSNLSWYTRLSILMTLHYYLMPVVAFFGMFLLVFLNLKNWTFYRSLSPFYLNSVEMLITNKTLTFWAMYLLLPSFLRGIFALREGISVRQYLHSSLFHRALFSATMWPVLRRLICFWDKKRLHFNVTSRGPYPSIRQIILLNGPGFVLIWIISLFIVLNPFWNGLNLLWTLPAFLSPFLIYYTQRKSHEE